MILPEEIAVHVVAVQDREPLRGTHGDPPVKNGGDKLLGHSRGKELCVKRVPLSMRARYSMYSSRVT